MTHSTLYSAGPDPDFCVMGGGGGAQPGEGSRGRLGPLCVQGGGSDGKAPDGKQFSVF